MNAVIPVTDLNQARYQDPTRGQFLSEDPIFLGDPRQQTLTDPQRLNSYSYANDNPTTKDDPSGRSSFTDMGFFNSYWPTGECCSADSAGKVRCAKNC
jgi:RHS repeat-associated protein